VSVTDSLDARSAYEYNDCLADDGTDGVMLGLKEHWPLLSTSTAKRSSSEW